MGGRKGGGGVREGGREKVKSDLHHGIILHIHYVRSQAFGAAWLVAEPATHSAGSACSQSWTLQTASG